MRRQLFLERFAFLATLAFLCSGMTALGCRSNDAAIGSPPPMGVEFVTLQPKSVERTTEYVGTVRSRRSTTIRPQVEGVVTRIAVRSGSRVRAGNLLLEIDGSRQRAVVASLESIRSARQADLEYARQHAERQRLLLTAGAVSRQETEQAEASLRNAEAQLRAVEEQIQEEQVMLGYHLVAAPTAGVIGDVPVRVGERVTTSTALTTIDGGEELELYLHVPVQQAAQLRVGLPVKVLDEARAETTVTAIDFVSPQVEERTQSVLAKAPLAAATGLRTEQFVRVLLVWREEQALTVPLVAVTRVSGVYFAFVAEELDGKTVARQRPLKLGVLVGNDYVVLDGLTAGERLIVSGVQKIGDGAPVNPKPADAPQAAGAQPGVRS